LACTQDIQIDELGSTGVLPIGVFHGESAAHHLFVDDGSVLVPEPRLTPSSAPLFAVVAAALAGGWGAAA